MRYFRFVTILLAAASFTCPFMVLATVKSAAGAEKLARALILVKHEAAAASI